MTLSKIIWTSLASLASAVILSGLVGIAAIKYTSDHKGNIKADMLEPVVKINGNCSAVSIGNQYLLTAAHCVSDPKFKTGTFKFETFNGVDLATSKDYYYDLQKLSVKYDLALLKMRSTENFPKVIIAKKIIAEEGDDLWAVGYPGGFNRTITSGLYNGLQVVNTNLRIRSTPAIFGGNSGGGLFQFNLGHYELIGITSAVWQSGLQTVPHMSISVSLDDIYEFLNTGYPRLKVIN